ncbi:2',3'-cyclic nucleotide 3'-phosphodiesterase [Xylographa opegraphella]|nr:2',3'-cyclic nucleotide 3'-phosphodiesterase [Xylographa opegraphella]
MAFSLWLTPPPKSPIYAQISDLIAELPKADPSLKSSPVFLPHITVVSGLPHASTSRLSLLVFPPELSVSVASLSFGAAYFKKIYFSIERSHTLIELATEARVKLNNMSDDEAQRAVENEYDPHASLVYNDVDLNETIREVVSHTVKERLEMFGYTALEGLGWKGGQLLLVKTEGPVEQWEVLKTISSFG